MFPIDEEILRLEISMYDIELMQISYSTDHLFKVTTSFIFLNFRFLDNIIEQLAFLNILHDEKKVSGSLNDLNR